MSLQDESQPQIAPRRLIVWGAGELGSRVARLWRTYAGPVTGFTQSEQRHPDLIAAGITPHTGSPVNHLQPDDALLLSLPGHETQADAVKYLMAQGIAAPWRVVMISTIGYFGPQAHGIINEETPSGSDNRSHSIAAAEQVFRQWAGSAGIVIRCGGLYSQARGPMSALRRRRTMKVRPPDKTLALIHYDDAATAIFEALRHLSPEPVYLAVVPPCPTREEFYTQACQRLELPAPQFDPPIGMPPAQYQIDRLRRDLLPVPAYPDWQAALEI
ncbi:MAG: hypothetical protein H6631_17540 [Anaerolineaceae bacterium]|nr:hypothetical protein [Anaerolineaceae bacterium]MCB9101895.1 hypothetical protein [Anaerolineales bacterium]